MRGNLKYAVARRVDDGFAGAHMLFAQLFYDFGSGGRFVAESLSADQTLEFSNQIGRESIFVDWERLVQPDACHFPMSGSGVFTGRMRCSFAVRTERSSDGLLMLQRSDICQT